MFLTVHFQQTNVITKDVIIAEQVEEKRNVFDELCHAHFIRFDFNRCKSTEKKTHHICSVMISILWFEIRGVELKFWCH